MSSSTFNLLFLLLPVKLIHNCSAFRVVFSPAESIVFGKNELRKADIMFFIVSKYRRIDLISIPSSEILCIIVNVRLRDFFEESK
jgi:hypothetical protein